MEFFFVTVIKLNWIRREITSPIQPKLMEVLDTVPDKAFLVTFSIIGTLQGVAK